MKIKCLNVKTDTLPPSYYARGESDHSERQYLKVGGIYNVYGIICGMNCIYYLIYVESQGPTWWVPAPLFELIDSSMPKQWVISYKSDADEEKYGFPLRIGYEHLVFNRYHFDGLIDRNPDDIRIFLLARENIDNNSKECSDSS